MRYYFHIVSLSKDRQIGYLYIVSKNDIRLDSFFISNQITLLNNHNWPPYEYYAKSPREIIRNLKKLYIIRRHNFKDFLERHQLWSKNEKERKEKYEILSPIGDKDPLSIGK